MNIDDLKGKLVAVVGFGSKEGVATAEYLIKHGVTPVLFDAKPWDAWSAEKQKYIKSLKVNFIFGPGYLEELKNFDVAFRNPAVPRLHPELLKREKEGLIITSQTKWFFEHCPAKIIGITGTKGKGTTSSLVWEIMNEKLKMVNEAVVASLPSNSSFAHLTGNIGGKQPFEILDNLTEQNYVVYELSSFQLQDVSQSPHISIVLMVTQDHLDHHKNLQEYFDAKKGITRFQKPEDVCIFNADYPASIEISNNGDAVKIPYSIRNKILEGCDVHENTITVHHPKAGTATFDASKLQLAGRHNLENISPAVIVGLLEGLTQERIQKTIENFKGLEHRLEFVTERLGVKFYNDSFSTTPDSAIVAVQAFSGPEIIILGGSSKNADFTELGKTIAATKNVKAVMLIGQEGPRIEQAIKNADDFTGKIESNITTIIELFEKLHHIAEKGDTVVLSPACASFGMFTDYKDRGNQFKQFAQIF